MKGWERVQALFEETLDLDATERARVLDERTEGDVELRRQVEALIAADATPLAAFEGGASELLASLRGGDSPPEADPEELCGTTAGAYRIEELRASGGMAHVYRATRLRAGTERRVALKVLRPGLNSTAFLRRFQRERETLAGLEHEHIVSFLDAGTLPDGRPYLVMEYVEGEELCTWGRSASRARKLEIFLQVLAAVQYAHQQLIVHRDLKPSNVLVTPDGVPRLLDFGVASVLAAEGDSTPGRGPLTPSHASPEQRSGAPVTTASDVYSLGVLLGELFDAGTGNALDPDLAAIVRRARAHEPAQRYGSAAQFADDLRRYLRHEPLVARPSSWTYRTRLFLRRNAWPCTLVAGVLVALTLGWIGADLERRLAKSEASAGWGAHAQARVTARILEGWITTAVAEDPTLAVEAAAYLEAALEEDLAALPETATLLHLTLAQLYLDHDRPERAAFHAERASSLAEVTRGVGEQERLRALALLERSARAPGSNDR